MTVLIEFLRFLLLAIFTWFLDTFAKWAWS